MSGAQGVRGIVFSPQEQNLLAELRRLARAGAPCPSNPDLADLIGYVDPASITRALGRMRQAGLIDVTGVGLFRTVRISGTNDCTAVRTEIRRASAMHSSAVAAQSETPLRGDVLEARIAADQARIHERRLRWLDVEQQKYGLPKRGRAIEEMPI